jgi:ATP-dependent protease ClpP protease subunit
MKNKRSPVNMANGITAVARRFDVRNLSPDEAEIYLYNAIGDCYEGVTAKQFIDEVTAKAANAKTLTLNINSPGGSVYDADAIFNFLSRHPAKKVANIDGIAASAACTIAMACTERNIAQNAMMMVHRVADFAFGNADDMRSTADVLDKLDKTVCDTYARATGQTPEKCDELMDDETWMGADEAKSLGFATAIVGEKQAAALAGFSAANVAKLKFKHPDKMSSLVVSGDPTNKGQAQSPAKQEEPTVAQENPAGKAGGQAEPINLAEEITKMGKKFKEAFGPENGAKYLADGMTFEAAQAQNVLDLRASNTKLTEEKADLQKRLDAANKALGVDPLSADVSDAGGTSEKTAGEKKYAGLLKAFNGDEKRAKKAFATWQANQAKKNK